MTVGERIRALRKAQGISAERIAEVLGVSPATIYRYENGYIEKVPGDVLEPIAQALHTTPAYLMGWENADDAIEDIAGDVGTLVYILNQIERDPRIPESLKIEFRDYIPSNPFHSIAAIQNAASTKLTVSERHLLAAYRKASVSDQQIIDNIAARYPVEEVENAHAVKIIPLFGTAAAASPGEFSTGLPWEEYIAPADSGASFAVKISDGSMEPVLHDGQIALCAEKTPGTGDVAVMMVNGRLVVKQFQADNAGNICLRSLNRNYKRDDVTVMATGADAVACYGVVLLNSRPPLAAE